MGLADRANALASTLSGGMRRRLEIARGLVHNPQILFLDEPTTGLDPVSRISVWEMITHLRVQEGRTLFLTTHYMDEADRLCDRLAIVDKGKVVAMDTPVSLKSSVPGASRIEIQFEPDLPNGAADLERLPAVKSVRALGSCHLSRVERPRTGVGAGTDRIGARSQAGIEGSLGAIHYFGRRVPALHRPRPDGDAGNGRRSRRTSGGKEATHEARLSFSGARYAQVSPQPGTDFCLAGAPAGAVGYLGQRVRGQHQERHSGCSQPGSRTRIGGCAGARPRGGRQCPHLPAHRLRRPGHGHRRPAQGSAGRSPDHSAALFPRPAGAASAAPGADYR